MTEPEPEAILRAELPSTWPELPPFMSMSTLMELESCPRRWALSRASYPSLWSSPGYPSPYASRALEGQVVHRALERITRALVDARCAAVTDPAAVSVLRDLGGYSAVLNECIAEATEALRRNPRARRFIERAPRDLRDQVPQLRTRTQAMLSRTHLQGGIAGHQGGAGDGVRRPLTTGVFPEMELRAQELRWKGRADVLALTPTTCEIVDFKTGVVSEEHPFQLRVYALLWSRDVERNPERRLADRLVLRYPTEDVEVAAPTASELDQLEQELSTRSAAARTEAARRPAEARPNAENCRYCAVRQLCDEYWSYLDKAKSPTNEEERFADFQLEIVERHGPTSWDTVVHRGSPSSGAPALFRAGKDFDLAPGDRLRVLGAGRSRDENDGHLEIITLLQSSEVFALP